MPSIHLYMPRCGADGVIVATRDDGVRVEFRGAAYSDWDLGEDSPMYRLHSCLRRINISELHCGNVETVTPWHDEWEEVRGMFEAGMEVTLLQA
ncbi:MAG: hypothetical protein JWN43_108 [Gammaproteobacteria bacterium]|nr:hypothetical protein [Gammaproteobacteria bacterium]